MNLTSRSFTSPLLLAGTLFVLALAFSSPDSVFAKRLAPPTVEPVVIGGMRFTVENQPKSMGIIQASNAKTHQALWTVRLYEVSYVPGLEKDVQDVFIKSMRSEKGKLRAVDEKGREYEVDPATRKSRPIKQP